MKQFVGVGRFRFGGIGILPEVGARPIQLFPSATVVKSINVNKGHASIEMYACPFLFFVLEKAG